MSKKQEHLIHIQDSSYVSLDMLHYPKKTAGVELSSRFGNLFEISWGKFSLNFFEISWGKFSLKVG